MVTRAEVRLLKHKGSTHHTWLPTARGSLPEAGCASKRRMSICLVSMAYNVDRRTRDAVAALGHACVPVSCLRSPQLSSFHGFQTSGLLVFATQ